MRQKLCAETGKLSIIQNIFFSVVSKTRNKIEALFLKQIQINWQIPKHPDSLIIQGVKYSSLWIAAKLNVSKMCEEVQPGRRRVCEYRQGHRGGLGLWAGSGAGSPHRGIWSAEVGTLVSPPQSSGHTACETLAASPGALTWPWQQSLSSCTPQNHSLWSAPWWSYTPESNAPGYQKVEPTPQTAAG